MVEIEPRRLVVLGIGNLDVGPFVVGALATYFGERPFDVVLYDKDAEKLELFGRFAQVAFQFNRTPHDLMVTTDLAEAIASVWRLVVCLPIPYEQEIEDLASEFQTVCVIRPVGTNYGDLMTNAAIVAEVPRLDREERRAMPHQILRWVRGEDYLHEFFREHEASPIKSWLDSTALAEL